VTSEEIEDKVVAQAAILTEDVVEEVSINKE
jgi:hypothetical protein